MVMARLLNSKMLVTLAISKKFIRCSNTSLHMLKTGVIYNKGCSCPKTVPTNSNRFLLWPKNRQKEHDH